MSFLDAKSDVAITGAAATESNSIHDINACSPLRGWFKGAGTAAISDRADSCTTMYTVIQKNSCRYTASCVIVYLCDI